MQSACFLHLYSLVYSFIKAPLATASLHLFVHLFVCLSTKCVQKNATFRKTKQFMVSINDY